MEKIATLLGLTFTDTGHRHALAGLGHRLGLLDRQRIRHWEGQTVAPHSGGSISSGPTHERQSCIKLRDSICGALSNAEFSQEQKSLETGILCKQRS